MMPCKIFLAHNTMKEINRAGKINQESVRVRLTKIAIFVQIRKLQGKVSLAPKCIHLKYGAATSFGCDIVFGPDP